jgi:3-dehydrotetronate 4-kinase
LAGVLTKHGMRTIQWMGVPPSPPDDDARVTLKSHSVLAGEAMKESLAACAICRQYFSKYCSTFDSTPRPFMRSKSWRRRRSCF